MILAGGQHVGADPREQQLLADVSHLVSRIIEAAPQRAFDQRPGFRIRVNRGPRDKSLAARHIKARAFQKALQGVFKHDHVGLVVELNGACRPDVHLKSIDCTCRLYCWSFLPIL